MEKNESKMSAAQRKEEKLELQRQAEEVKLLKVLEKKENAKRVKEEEKKRQEEIRASKEKAAKEARERAQKRKEEEAEARRREELEAAAKAMKEAALARAAVNKLKSARGAGPHVAIATAEDLKSQFKAANMAAHQHLDPAAKDAFKRMRESSFVTEVDPYKRNEAHRPHGRPEGALSRHLDTPPVSMVLMFNCYRAEYRLELGDIATLPDAEDVALKAVESLQTIGRVKISPDKGTPFMERLDFPNEWRVGDEHGLVHDGLQGDGYIELRMDWKHEGESRCALLRVNPWLSYACSEGARLAMRKPEQTEGRCATVQRALRDDSVVVRVDGMVGETTVDPSPLTVVRTTSPRHEPGTRLLFLHDGVCVDAVIEPWPEAVMDAKEGSRHRMRVSATTITGWISTVGGGKDGEAERENLRKTDGGDEDLQIYRVISSKAMLVRAGCEKTSDALGHINADTMVRVLEFRDASDGTKRAFVDSLAGEEQIVIAALNEFNHSVQRFAAAAEYESARANYCEDMVEREAMVEDAITGNMLRIKDQTLHVSTATDGVDNTSIPAEWRVNDVRDLVKLLLVAVADALAGLALGAARARARGAGDGQDVDDQAGGLHARRRAARRDGDQGGRAARPDGRLRAAHRLPAARGRQPRPEGPPALALHRVGLLGQKVRDVARHADAGVRDARADRAARRRRRGGGPARGDRGLRPQGARAVGRARPRHVAPRGRLRGGLQAPLRDHEPVRADQRAAAARHQRPDAGERVLRPPALAGRGAQEPRRGVQPAQGGDARRARDALRAQRVHARERRHVRPRPAASVRDRRALPPADVRRRRGAAHREPLPAAPRPRAPRDAAAAVRHAAARARRRGAQEDELRDDGRRARGARPRGHAACKRHARAAPRRRRAPRPADSPRNIRSPAVPPTRGGKGRRRQGVPHSRSLQSSTGGRSVSRTDEYYVLAEQMAPIFDFGGREVVKEVGRDDDEGERLARDMIVAPLKDPVRLHEKGVEDFSSRFSDDVLPEACVTDVVRARIGCYTGAQVADLVTRLIEGNTYSIDAGTFPLFAHERAKLERLREERQQREAEAAAAAAAAAAAEAGAADGAADGAPVAGEAADAPAADAATTGGVREGEGGGAGEAARQERGDLPRAPPRRQAADEGRRAGDAAGGSRSSTSR